MSMNYKRNRTQCYIEGQIGILNTGGLKSKKQEFKNYSLNDIDVINIDEIIQKDALDHYYSGIISIADGMNSLIERKYSWATVKLYYGIYYLLRATLGLNKYSILYNGEYYSLKNEKFEKPKEIKNKRNTHNATIYFFINHFKTYDYLLSNEINGKNTYIWMMEAREITNYRSCSFMEPMFHDFWEKIDKNNNKEGLQDIIENIYNQPDLFCFQEEYAIVAIPIKRLLLTTNLFQKFKIINKMKDYKMEYIEKILFFKSVDINLFKILF